MRKIILLPVMMLFFVACSTDDSSLYENDEAAVMNEEVQEENRPLYAPCFLDITGNVTIDASNGLNNPVVVFAVNTENAVGSFKGYRVRLEVQKIADCEDFYSDFDSIILYESKYSHSTQTGTSVIRINANDLPSVCYKWRFVVESGNPDFSSMPYCFSASQWYEAPLF